MHDISKITKFTKSCVAYYPYDTTKAKDILNAVISYFTKYDIGLSKLFWVTTDGSAAMAGNKKGFVKLLENHVGRKLLNFHCIIHQESLCAKT